MANQKKIPTKREVPKNCIFCKEDRNPDFLDIETLKKFTTDRGKIISASKSGLCMKHQKKITLSVKRARHLALLPFVVQPE